MKKTKMIKFSLLSLLCMGCFFGASAYANEQNIQTSEVPNAYDFVFTSIDGTPMPLSEFKGNVLMVVNTASQCGFTGQYQDLQKIYSDFKDQGFVVIGVPCNQFGNQEPDPEETIAKFVARNYGVTFPLTSKAEVSGDRAHPFFKWATAQEKGGFLFSKPRWNFHKFVIDRNGQVAESFGSQVNPDSDKVRKALTKLLEKNEEPLSLK